MGEFMTKAKKLEIIENQNKIYFEKGKDRIVSIEILEEHALIKIKYDDPDWDYIFIPFNNLMSFKFKEEIEFRY